MRTPRMVPKVRYFDPFTLPLRKPVTYGTLDAFAARTDDRVKDPYSCSEKRRALLGAYLSSGTMKLSTIVSSTAIKIRRRDLRAKSII